MGRLQDLQHQRALVTAQWALTLLLVRVAVQDALEGGGILASEPVRVPAAPLARSRAALPLALA